MNIQASKITKLTLTDIPRLDPVSVFLEDLGPRRGRIVIECFGTSWASYWGGMGDESIAEFFVSCNDSYLAGKLAPQTKSAVVDYEQLSSVAMKQILSNYKNGQIERHQAEELRDRIRDGAEYFHDEDAGKAWCTMNSDLMFNVFGDEWWCDLPTTSNHEYNYLIRIITAVREGLVEYLKTKETEAETA